jgi:hypothetical protein
MRAQLDQFKKINLDLMKERDESNMKKKKMSSKNDLLMNEIDGLKKKLKEVEDENKKSRTIPYHQVDLRNDFSSSLGIESSSPSKNKLYEGTIEYSGNTKTINLKITNKPFVLTISNDLLTSDIKEGKTTFSYKISEKDKQTKAPHMRCHNSNFAGKFNFGITFTNLNF